MFKNLWDKVKLEMRFVFWWYHRVYHNLNLHFFTLYKKSARTTKNSDYKLIL